MNFMTKYLAEFKEVGRDKLSWSVQLCCREDRLFDELERAIRSKRALLSRDIGFDPAGPTDDSFWIYVGGFRGVGSVKVTEIGEPVESAS